MLFEVQVDQIAHTNWSNLENFDGDGGLCEERSGMWTMLVRSEIHQLGGDAEQSTNVLGIVQRPQSFAVLLDQTAMPAIDAPEYFGHLFEPSLINAKGWRAIAFIAPLCRKLPEAYWRDCATRISIPL